MVGLAAVLVGASVLVDPRAESAFDAPKRLVTLLGIAVAVGALLAFPRQGSDAARSWRNWTTAQRVAVALATAALAITLIASVVSPRRATALDATRTLLLTALLLPLGASRALEGRRAWILVGAYLSAGAVNAVVSLLQFAGGLRLFSVESIGGRRDVSAFVGNDGVLALSLAPATLICLALVLAPGSSALRVVGGCGIVLYLSALAVNQSLTALTALAAGSFVMLALSLRRRSLIGGLIVILVLLGGVLAHPTLARRAHKAVDQVRAGNWDHVMSYRWGPWAAAVEMARSRPLVGWGAGTFGAEFVVHRLGAELRLHRRLVNPFLAGSYGEAHSEYLQAAAEAGVPAGLACLGAVGALAVGVLGAIRRARDGSSRGEAILVLAILCSGAAAALTWSPLQRPITAVPLLLAAGRAWRCSGHDDRAVAA
jgi:O-antigen ligase